MRFGRYVVFAMCGDGTSVRHAVIQHDLGGNIVLVSYSRKRICGSVSEETEVVVFERYLRSLKDVSTLKIDEPRTVDVSSLAWGAFKAGRVRGAILMISPALRAGLPIAGVSDRFGNQERCLPWTR